MTDEQRGAIQELKSHGWNIASICRALSLNEYKVRKVFDPEAHAQRVVQRQQRRKQLEPVNGPHVMSRYRPSPELLKRLWSAVPADTRDVTGFVMGDPLPGRSALDKMNCG